MNNAVMQQNASAELETVLARLLEAHETLLALAREHRRAISSADAGAMEACARRQGEIAADIAALDDHRRRLAAILAGDHSPPQISRIAAALPEPARGRIAGLAARLREVLITLQEQHRILRAAAGALAGHMDGLMQQVARTINSAGGTHAGTYGRQGRVHAGPASCALDMQH